MSIDTENSLLSISDAANYLGTSTATTEINDAIGEIINVVSYRFNDETGRPLKNRSHTEYRDGNGKNILYLSQYPISSTTITITIDGTRAFTSTDYIVTSTDVVLSTDSGEIRLDGYTFDIGQRNVKIQYSAGYSSSGAHSLTQAAKEYVKLIYDRRTKKGNAEAGIRSESWEGHSITYENDLPWSVKSVLDMYRKRDTVGTHG